MSKKINGTYYTAIATPDSKGRVLAVEGAFISNSKADSGTVLNIRRVQCKENYRRCVRDVSIGLISEIIDPPAIFSQRPNYSSINTLIICVPEWSINGPHAVIQWFPVLFLRQKSIVLNNIFLRLRKAVF